MRMPNGDRAVVDMAKLRDYCLSETHPRGKHKARVFAATLGLTVADAAALRDALLDAALSGDAQLVGEDPYGNRYCVDFPMTTLTGTATVRSLWIVRPGEGHPRLVTCYIV